jgi:hypothetical protein
MQFDSMFKNDKYTLKNTLKHLQGNGGGVGGEGGWGGGRYKAAVELGHDNDSPVVRVMG